MAFTEAKAPDLDVYVGVAPRVRRGGGKNDIAHSWLLYVDCDTADAAARAREFTPRASLIVRSGTGNNVHAYWALDAPLSPAWFERANRRLAFRLGADLKVTDAARILRPPGSLNHKTDPPVLVSVESLHPAPVSVARVVKNLPDPPSKPHMAREPRANVMADDPLLGISADRFYSALTGREIMRGNVTCPFHGDGKERNPSLRLYEQTWFCFGCCKGGTVYEFAAALWGLGTRGTDFLELRERLTRELT